MGWMELGNNEGAVGDEAWDLCDDFLDELSEIYVRNWSRKPTKKEIISTLEFCMSDDFEETLVQQKR
jgi:hypothetical protein